MYLYDLDTFISTLVDEAPVKDCVIALSDSENYRKEIAPYYKANRSGTRKPMLLSWVREYIQKNYNTIIYRRLEADDVLGILGSSNSDTIIWSEDKDLLTVPAKHWIGGQVVEQSVEQKLDYQFFAQTLAGDNTDNYSDVLRLAWLLPKNCLTKIAHGIQWLARIRVKVYLKQ